MARPILSRRGSSLPVLLALSLALLLPVELPAQSSPDEGRADGDFRPGARSGNDGGGRSRSRRERPSSANANRTPNRDRTGGNAAPSDPRGTQPRASDATASADKDKDKAPETAAAPTEGEEVGWFGKLRGWIQSHSTAVLTVLGTLLTASVAWWGIAAIRQRRRKEEGADFLEPLDDEEATKRARRRYSSARISASAVNERLGVVGEKTEADREYALVVDEEALRVGEVDQNTGRRYVEDGEIRAAIHAEDFESAWLLYREAIDADGEAEFRSDIERALSEHFLKQRDLDRAAQILEHHVATHARKDIDPEVYFNLGYVHILRETYNKSRRFLRLFVESGNANPVYTARARSILEQLESR